VDARSELPVGAAALAAERASARAARDYARSDALRAELNALGYDVIDGPDGQEVRRR
jgi:cysteinyl-tRNA synthetase